MKKMIPVILSAALLLSLTACGGRPGAGNSTTDVGGSTAASGESTSPDTYYSVGDTVTTDFYQFTLKNATFTDSILVCYGDKADKPTFTKAEEFFTPIDTLVDKDGYIIDGVHGFSANVDSGKTFLYYNLEVQFIGKERLIVKSSWTPGQKNRKSITMPCGRMDVAKNHLL